ncbi:hypothetical protein [Flavobacterium koreense]
MIDINHPNSQFIFEASGYTDRIKNYCRIYINESFEQRIITFEKMKQECLNLKTFSEEHFKDRTKDIYDVTQKLISEIDSLQKINNETTIGNCKVCDNKLKTFDSRVKEVGFITICNNCPTIIYELTNNLEGLTGAAWI